MLLADDFIEAYRKGSKPSSIVSEADWFKMRDFSIHSMNQLEEDITLGKFQSYEAYTTSYGLTLNSIKDAVRFNAMHESMHLGYAMALLRALQ